eukprot:SAG11_NODE_11891_length_733_cov_0.769716_1_plen_135_part_00
MYNGEADNSTHPQSTGIMERAIAEAGGTMQLVLAPGTGHEYEPQALTEVLRRLGRHAAAGVDHHPDKVQIQTQTLRYAKVHWLAATGLMEHWTDCRLTAERRHVTNGPAGAATSKLTATANGGVSSFTADPIGP